MWVPIEIERFWLLLGCKQSAVSGSVHRLFVRVHSVRVRGGAVPDYAASKHQSRHATKATIVPAYVTRRSALHYPCAELCKCLTRKCSLNLTHRFLQHPFSTQHTARHYARKQNGAWRSCAPGQTKITLHISLGVESCTFHWEWNPAYFTGNGILHISLGVESCTFHWEWDLRG